MKKFFGILILMFIFSFVGCSNEEKIEQLESQSKTPDTEKIEDNTSHTKQYDKLQRLFLSITPHTTKADIKNYISENSLEVGESERCGGVRITVVTYKIAYKKGVTFQNHAESGDYIEIEFVKDTDYLFDVIYRNLENDAEATFYNPQIFKEQSGYFYEILEWKQEGRRSNLSKSYYPCKNAIEAVDKVLSHKR